MSGAEIASEAADAIRGASAEVGSGEKLSGVIIRQGVPDESTYPVTPAVDQVFACDLIWSEYSVMDRQGSNISVTDVKAIITSDSETDPRNGDRLQVGGVTYNLDNVSPYKPGGVVLYYEATARKG